MTEPVTQFRLQPVDTRVGPIASLMIDNGAGPEKPNTFGRAALESLATALDRLEGGDWRGLLLTGKPSHFAAGADMTQFPGISRELALAGGRAGHELFGRLRALPFPHTRGDQRHVRRRRRGDRAPLRPADDLDRCAVLRLPRGGARPDPGLGRDAADPEARRRRARRPVHRHQPVAPEPDARRAQGARARLRRPPLRAGRAGRRIARVLLRAIEEGVPERQPAELSRAPPRSSAWRGCSSTRRSTAPRPRPTARST